MRKIGLLLLIILSIISPVFAEYGLTLEQFLNTYVNVVVQDQIIPDTYRYIELKYPNISPSTKLYETLQKAVYLDLFPNADIELPLDKQITQEQVMKIVSSSFEIDVFVNKKSLVTVDWLKDVLLEIQYIKSNNLSVDNLPFNQKNEIIDNPLFLDIYKKLQDNYISDSGLDQKSLLYGAIKGFVEGLNDPYTSFFPPTETNLVLDELRGEYYGIGAYVEMNKPGELIVVSPIKGSPAEKIGLLGGDRIVQINDKFVDKDMSLTLATSIIKGPKGTSVKLKVLRDGKLLDFDVIRDKIVINNVESKIYTENNLNTCLVAISMFDFGVARDFQKIMTDLSDKKCVKYIFDVRNNPGGGLDEVVRMLNYFVPNGETSVIIKSRFITEEIIAWDVPSVKIQNIPVRVLINQGSASASEIFAGVIRDYVPGVLLVGEKTFGKGSVQELFNYEDGSMLKYTIAKRYMGKSQINIDKIGISPDKILVNKKDTPEDEVLEWAILN
ncbi:MAG: S41 family peptidase [Candidatus Absconditabacteria bacterium]|nr:S41 family peptidase [Candidatus Absconditabacteria bacterium]